LRHFAAAALLLAGCAPARLQSDPHAVYRQLLQAREAGAFRCQPAAFAAAMSNYEFALMEFNADNLQRADEHLITAKDAATRAQTRPSPCEAAGDDSRGPEPLPWPLR